MQLAGRQLVETLVVAGVGNRDRADDGFGPALARRLLIRGWGNAIDCGDRLEDYTADIASKKPKTILIADAVEMRAQPGKIALFEISGLPPVCHAHAPSLRTAMEYLRARTGAEVLLLGVQPGRVCNGQGLSREVKSALNEIVEMVTRSGAEPGKSHHREDEWASRTR